MLPVTSNNSVAYWFLSLYSIKLYMEKSINQSLIVVFR